MLWNPNGSIENQKENNNLIIDFKKFMNIKNEN